MGELVVAIDIGTSKICVLCGDVSKTGQLEILGKSVVPCAGVKKGLIIDIETTANAISEGLRQVETAAGVKIGSAYINVMGLHVDVFTNKCAITNMHEDREIQKKDVDRLMYLIRSIDVPEDIQIIDIMPRQYIIDGISGISEPVGMVGVTIELEADIVTGKITSIANFIRCIEASGIKIDGLVVSAQALSEVMLSPEEMDMGVILLDIGGSLTDMAVFKNGKLHFYNSLLIGGDHITNDISIGMKMSYSEAEKIKREYELALVSLIKNDQEFYFNDINDNSRKKVRISEIVEIIEARVYEIFTMSKKLLEENGVAFDFGAGVVLTGSGIVYLDGNKQIANDVFGMPVKVYPARAHSSQRVETVLAEGIVKHVYKASKGMRFGSDVMLAKNREILSDGGIISKIIAFLKHIF
ncbi:MAG: cell division protein FtsA [Oscillospiraceae bacterium]|nr:cell division protein FtsA [Oscillospiraceae bacterium]